MARVLLTGSNGFAGWHVSKLLSEAGHQVVGLSKNSKAHCNPWLAVNYCVDLTDYDALKKLIKEISPDQAIHLAAISFVGHSKIDDIYHNNIVGTRNLLDSLASLDRFSGPALIVSSANVYGAMAVGMVDETAPALPANDYGISKLAGEHLARIYQNRVPSIVMRPFNYTGVGQSTQFLIPKIVDHIKRRSDSIELGNLDVSRDFSDVRFFSQVCQKLLQCPNAVGETLNICSGVAYSLRQIIDMVESISQHNLRVRVNPDFVRANEVKELWGNPSKLKSFIGETTAPSLQETLEWMLKSEKPAS